jgi:3-deoxy-manno-octulosonate cytidylyltransferase (CMP-KDO synthetase)
MERALAVVPARLASSRLRGKLLLEVGGIPLLVHTLRRASGASRVSRVVVATADDEIAAAAEAHGFAVARTSDAPRNGTERVWEVARDDAAELVLNVQGDEALVDPWTLDALVASLSADGGPDVVTAAAPLDAERARDPDVVKVVTREDGRALYFSRSPVPCAGPALQHIGVYGFRKAALRRCVEGPPSALETAERLEQLRWLERGLDIQVVRVAEATPAVNVAADLERIRRILGV